ncbi:hypothetical protein RUM43_005681 [Polyplax serrata]|uniref:Zinc finger HIT domain-containing protein n=1 Tax=Polyplax serrata TaxID=468196 RepID=A0AAN8NX58_POLSC
MKAEDCTQVETKTTKYFTEDTIDPERLSKLGESNKIKNLLKNKYLRSTLSAVENATNPENAVFEAMKNPDFVKFVDECLQIVEDLDVS